MKSIQDWKFALSDIKKIDQYNDIFNPNSTVFNVMFRKLDFFRCSGFKAKEYIIHFVNL